MPTATFTFQDLHLTWYDTKQTPARGSLGILETKPHALHTIKATVSERVNKTWHWRTVSPNGVGFEPTFEDAVKAAENFLISHA
jgi:hypothetical protein